MHEVLLAVCAPGATQRQLAGFRSLRKGGPGRQL
jgi:hypothetical protein